MKRLAVISLVWLIGCGDRTPVVDRGGKSLDVPVPSRGVAAPPRTEAGQNMFEFPKRMKQDPSEIGTHSGALGTYLVDKGGRALYVFSEDLRGEPSCLTNCASVWPPVIVKELPPGTGGVDGAQLTMITRPDGSRQLAYARLPLYYADADLKPDDTWGHYAMSFGGRFALVGVDGKPLPAPK